MNDTTFAALNLAGNPFSMATSQEGFYHTQATRIILEELAHGVETRKGFMALIGEVGVGKTSLSLQLFSLLEGKNAVFAWVFNSMFTKEELFRAITDDFGLHSETNATLLDFQKHLHAFFLEKHHAGHTCVIVVDEAHNLNDDSLEALRMLGNFEFGGNKLVQVILIAQPELAARLEHPGLRQLKSRIAIYQVLPQFTRRDLIGYVNFKLSEAGSQLRLSGWAAWMLWRATRGNVRHAKLIMERALYGCLAYRTQTLTPTIMRLAIREINRNGAAALSSPPRWPVWTAGALCVLLVALSLIPFWSSGGSRVRAVDVVLGLFANHTAQHSVTPGEFSSAEIHALRAVRTFAGDDVATALHHAVTVQDRELLAQALAPGTHLIPLEILPSTGASPAWISIPWKKLTGASPTWLVVWKTDFSGPIPAPGETAPIISYAQQRLHDLGYFAKPVSGTFNAPTRHALSDFQRAAGLPATGALDLTTLFWLQATSPTSDTRTAS